MAVSKYYIAALYVAFLNRAPEGDGLESWYNAVLQNDWSLNELADSILAAIIDVVKSNPEYSRVYPQYANLDTNDYFSVRNVIEDTYKIIFNKDYQDDPEGIESWTRAVVDYGQPLGNVIASIVYTALNTDWSNNPSAYKAYLSFTNKIDVALFCSEKIKEFDGNFYKFQDFISNVDDTSSSVLEAKDKIEYYSVKNISPTINYPQEAYSYIQALYSGYKWNMDTISYSFPTQPPADYNSILTPSDLDTWQPLTSSQISKAREIISYTDKIINPDFIEVDSQNGDIRFSQYKFSGNYSQYEGYAYYPNIYFGYGGDVFFNSDYFHNPPNKYDIHVITHEFGHALGLKHPFSSEFLAPYTLPENLDNALYTVMSYNPPPRYLKINIEPSGRYYTSYAIPEGFQLLDILTLQYLYGREINATTGNNVYNISSLFKNGDYKTIFDTDGLDTIDASDTKYPDIINLKDGSFSSIDLHTIDDIVKDMVNVGWSESGARNQLESIGTDNIYTGENNLAIAYDTIIENVITGSGNDIIKDNEADNNIITNDGDDTIYIIYGGDDFVDGGNGYDTIVFSGLSSYDVNFLSQNSFEYFNNVLTFENIEAIEFTDRTIYL